MRVRSPDSFSSPNNPRMRQDKRDMSDSYAAGRVFISDAPIIINGSIWTMLAVATVFMGLRFYCRRWRSGQFWWDDHILAASWALLLTGCAMLSNTMDRGLFGSGMGNPDIIAMTKASHTCHLISLALSKTSFAVTLLRFSSKWQKIVIWFVIGSISTIFTIHIFLLWRPLCGDQSTRYSLPGECWGTQNPIILNIVSSSAYLDSQDPGAKGNWLTRTSRLFSAD